MFSSFNDDSQSRFLEYRGEMLIVAGGYALSRAFSPLFGLPGWIQWTVAAVGFVLMIHGAFITFRSRQHSALARRDVEALVGSPPVVYLRPFVQDSSMVPYIIMGFFRWERVSLEEQLADATSDIGPLVAIGRPNEHLPQLGATRIYADDNAWRDVVDRWLSEAELVILRPGNTPGVQWELARAIERVSPDAFLILLIRLKRRSYELFSGSVLAECGILLPESRIICRWGRVSGFIAFGEAWQASFLPLQMHFWRGPGVRAMNRRFYYALKPVYFRLGMEWLPLPFSWTKAVVCVVGVYIAFHWLMAYGPDPIWWTR